MAELTGLPVPCMDWSSADIAHSYRKFKSLCELMFTGPLSSKMEEEQVKYLLIWSGEEGIELSSTSNLTVAEKKLLSTHCTRFESFVAPKSNFRLSRFKLRSLKQGPTETFDNFIKKVRLLVSECKFVDFQAHIIDALIFGTNSERVQSKLIQKDEKLTLDIALDIARTEEATQQQLSYMASNGTQAVHAIAKMPYKPLRQQSSKAQALQAPKVRQCGSCGREHARAPWKICPANKSSCSHRGKPNH